MANVRQRQQGRGWHGHFLGFWARLNCEEMPVIPAWLVRANLDDDGPSKQNVGRAERGG